MTKPWENVVQIKHCYSYMQHEEHVWCEMSEDGNGDEVLEFGCPGW